MDSNRPKSQWFTLKTGDKQILITDPRVIQAVIPTNNTLVVIAGRCVEVTESYNDVIQKMRDSTPF